MSTALTYGLTSIALPLIMLALGKIAERPRPDANVYAYPKKIIWTIFAAIFFLIVVVVVANFVTPRRSSDNPALIVAIWMALLLLLLLACLHIRSYRIVLTGSVLHVSSLFFRKTVDLDSVRRFAIIHGGRGGQFLELYDAQDRMVFRASDTIRDFSDLTSLIHHQVAGQDISFDSRDNWGEWTRGRYDNAAKIRDQERRKLDIRNAALFFFGGLAFVAIVAFVLRRMWLL